MGPRTTAPSTPFWTLSIVPVSPLTLWKAPLTPPPRPGHSGRLPLRLAPRPRTYNITSPRRKSTFFCSDSFELIQFTLFQTKPSFSCSNFQQQVSLQIISVSEVQAIPMPRRPEVAGIDAAQGQVLIQEEDESVSDALE